MSAEIEAGDGDLDKRLGQKLNPALALALTVLAADIEQRDPISSSSTPLATSNDVLANLLSLCDGPDEYLGPEGISSNSGLSPADRFPLPAFKTSALVAESRLRWRCLILFSHFS